jgi:hypothetical protein
MGKSQNNAGMVHVVVHLNGAPLLEPSIAGYAHNFAHVLEIRDQITNNLTSSDRRDMLENATIQACQLDTFSVEKWKYTACGNWIKVF